MQYILDACTIINLLHIDEDEFLLKKLSACDFLICKTVLIESRKNVFKKFEKLHPYPQDRHDLIDKKIDYFRQKVYNDECYLELTEVIAKLTNYKGRNGEFYSILLSFFLNTFDKKYILFVTDDGPAKNHFSQHLEHHKIGYINDSVDLLIFLYRHSDEFSRNDLKKFLSSLYSEYVIEISDLEKKVNSIEIPKQLLKNRDIIYGLQKIRASLSRFDLRQVDQVYKEVITNQKKYKFLFEVLEPYSYFFEKNASTEYLSKIKKTIVEVDSKPFFKFSEN